MTPKQEQEKIAQLEKELAKKDEQIAGLTKRVAELEAVKPASKSRQMAAAMLALLDHGPVTIEQLQNINPKYPSDCAYYVRNLLKIPVHTVRTAAGTVYMDEKHFTVYSEGLAREKASKEASEKEAKEEIQTSQEAVAA